MGKNTRCRAEEKETPPCLGASWFRKLSLGCCSLPFRWFPGKPTPLAMGLERRSLELGNATGAPARTNKEYTSCSLYLQIPTSFRLYVKKEHWFSMGIPLCFRQHDTPENVGALIASCPSRRSRFNTAEAGVVSEAGVSWYLLRRALWGKIGSTYILPTYFQNAHANSRPSSKQRACRKNA